LRARNAPKHFIRASTEKAFEPLQSQAAAVDPMFGQGAFEMTVREIQSHLQVMYGAEASPTLISPVTDGICDVGKALLSRKL